MQTLHIENSEIPDAERMVITTCNTLHSGYGFSELWRSELCPFDLFVAPQHSSFVLNMSRYSERWGGGTIYQWGVVGGLCVHYHPHTHHRVCVFIVSLPEEEAVKAELQTNCSFGCSTKGCSNWWPGICVCSCDVRRKRSFCPNCFYLLSVRLSEEEADLERESDVCTQRVINDNRVRAGTRNVWLCSNYPPCGPVRAISRSLKMLRINFYWHTTAKCLVSLWQQRCADFLHLSHCENGITGSWVIVVSRHVAWHLVWGHVFCWCGSDGTLSRTRKMSIVQPFYRPISENFFILFYFFICLWRIQQTMRIKLKLLEALDSDKEFRNL